MSFRLSQRSIDRLEGVHPDMTAVVERAIQLTEVDFGVDARCKNFRRAKG